MIKSAIMIESADMIKSFYLAKIINFYDLKNIYIDSFDNFDTDLMELSSIADLIKSADYGHHQWSYCQVFLVLFIIQCLAHHTFVTKYR